MRWKKKFIMQETFTQNFKHLFLLLSILQTSLFSFTQVKEKSTQQDSINPKLVINKLGKKEAKKKAKQKEMNEMPPELLQTQLAASSTTVNKPKEIAAKPITSNIKTVEIVADKNNTKHKSGWATFTDSVKQGQESICSQAQISMNQCH